MSVSKHPFSMIVVWTSKRLPALSTTFSPIQHRRWKSNHNNDNKDEKPLFLHIGPSGDCWTGDSIFAAKHLQPDYVRSVVLPNNYDDQKLEALLEAIEEDVDLQRQIYDEERIPETLLGRTGKD